MNTLPAIGPDAQLAAILEHMHTFRRCNLALETGRDRALDESRRLLGALAQFRHRLRQRPSAAAHKPRRAA